MATTAEINTKISALESQIASISESLRIALQSLGNIDPKYQANQAYIARLNTQVDGYAAQLQTLETQVNSLISQRAALERVAPAAPAPPTPTPVAETTTKVENTSPQPVGGSYSAVYDSDFQSWSVVNDADGTIVAVGFANQQEAVDAAAEFSITDPTANTPPVDPVVAVQDANQEADFQAAQEQETLIKARNQASLQQQRKQANDGDWRVKLRLAPGSTYLYNEDQNNVGPVLKPLQESGGVIFPYTPKISTVYKAQYESYDLTHSNHRGYFYKNSYVDDIQIDATFTAQDTFEANYMLAVIHFFRSVTKMFYGQDGNRGAPPPMVFLQGLGEYQFNLHPCVVAQFNYTLPSDVDYIRAGSVNNNGTDLLNRRDRAALPTNPFSAIIARLAAAGVKKGALDSVPAAPTLGINSPTYVPTKIDISVVLHPMQSREQISKQFSLKEFANGNLLKGGFW
jgi:hypothetical protein